MEVGYLEIVGLCVLVAIAPWLVISKSRGKVDRIAGGTLWPVAVYREAGQPDRVAIDSGFQHLIASHEAFALATLIDEAVRQCEASPPQEPQLEA